MYPHGFGFAEARDAEGDAAARATGLVAALVPLLLCAILSFWEPFGVRALRDLEFDAFQRWSPRVYDPETPVRVVAIDDEFVCSGLGQWPWPRAQISPS